MRNDIKVVTGLVVLGVRALNQINSKWSKDKLVYWYSKDCKLLDHDIEFKVLVTVKKKEEKEIE